MRRVAAVAALLVTAGVLGGGPGPAGAGTPGPGFGDARVRLLPDGGWVG